MAYLTLIITVPLTLFAVVFALSNGGDVTVSLLSKEHTWTLPLSVFGLGMLGAGFFLGALFVWIHYQKLRFRHWQERRRSARMEKELDALNKKLADAGKPPAATPPALRPGTP